MTGGSFLSAYTAIGSPTAQSWSSAHRRALSRYGDRFASAAGAIYRAVGLQTPGFGARETVRLTWPMVFVGVGRVRIPEGSRCVG